MKRFIPPSWKCWLSAKIISLFLFTTCPAIGQVVNFVPDPSFEDTLQVVGYLTPEALKHWQNLYAPNIWASRTVYFSLTQPDIAVRLLNTQWYYQYPRSGGGSLCMENTFYKRDDKNHRGLAKCKLKNTLIAGKIYFAKMHFVPGERFYSHFTDGISMYFDNGQLDTMISIHHDSSGIYPLVVPQIINPYGNIITDTINWTVLEGCFVANGTESYLTIGNFKSDSATARSINPFGELTDTVTGMLIDDISVYALDMQNWVPDAMGTINDSIIIGLPNYQIPDAKWYTLGMGYLGAGSEIKIYATQPQQQFVCAIDMCNTTVYDTFTVYAFPLGVYNNEGKGNGINIFPNPSTNKIYIEAKQNYHIQPISITTIFGKKVYSSSFNNYQEIETIDWARGVYFVKVGNEVYKIELR
jgi:hypothetical protein